jgi:hypothetical protein
MYIYETDLIEGVVLGIYCHSFEATFFKYIFLCIPYHLLLICINHARQPYKVSTAQQIIRP